MKINGTDYGGVALGNSIKTGHATITKTAFSGKIRTYIKSNGQTVTVKLDRLIVPLMDALLAIVTADLTVTEGSSIGVPDGTYVCMNNPLQFKEGRHFYETTLQLRKV